MGTEQAAQFSTFLANQRNVAINTQKIALNALAYLYQKHLHHELDGRDRLIIELLYGSGLRVSECLRLRIQDIERASLTVRDGKGHKDRQTILSHRCAEKLTTYIEKAIKTQQNDNLQGIGPSRRWIAMGQNRVMKKGEPNGSPFSLPCFQLQLLFPTTMQWYPTTIDVITTPTTYRYSSMLGHEHIRLRSPNTSSMRFTVGQNLS